MALCRHKIIAEICMCEMGLVIKVYRHAHKQPDAMEKLFISCYYFTTSLSTSTVYSIHENSFCIYKSAESSFYKV